jgi:hypothetical protein
MSEFKGTPGPWVVAHDHPDEETRKSLAFIRPTSANSYDGESIADIYCCGGDTKREANARLIAAAPALLEALRAMLDCYVNDPLGWMDKQNAASNLAEEAIAKATEGSQS